MDQQREAHLQLLEHDNLQYYVYYDLICLLTVASESQAVLEYFQDIPDHPMIRIAINRLILQVNLSNTIYVDQYENCQNHEQFNIFKKDITQKSKEIFALITNTELIKLINHYVERNLCLHNTICQLKTEKTNIQQHDYSQALQKLVQAMGTIEVELENLSKEHKHNVPSLAKLIALAKEKYEQAMKVLCQNFPDVRSKQSDNFHNNKEEIQNDKLEYPQQQQLNNSLVTLLDLIYTYMIMKLQRPNIQDKLQQFLYQTSDSDQLIQQIDHLNYKKSTALQELFKQIKNGLNLKQQKLKNIDFEYQEKHYCMIKNLLEFYKGNIQIKYTKNFIEQFYLFLINIKENNQVSQQKLQSLVIALKSQPQKKTIIKEISNFQERLQTTEIVAQLDRIIDFLNGQMSSISFQSIFLSSIQDQQLFELVLYQ